MSWERARQKFELLAAPHLEPERAADLADAVWTLDELDTNDLTARLGAITTTGGIR
jgi:hypothetical protein